MKEMICISCPIGCHLKVEMTQGKPETLAVEGNRCQRGLEYALAEMTAPLRVVTATVATVSSGNPRLAVKTAMPFPKERVFDLLELLSEVVVDRNVAAGEIILSNALDTGIDIVATGVFCIE